MNVAVTLGMSPALETAVYALIKALEGFAGVFPAGLGIREPVRRPEAPVPWDVVTVQSHAPPGDTPPQEVSGPEARQKRRNAQNAARVARHRAKKKEERGSHPTPPNVDSPYSNDSANEVASRGSETYSAAPEASTGNAPVRVGDAPDSITGTITEGITGVITDTITGITRGVRGVGLKETSTETTKNNPPKAPQAITCNAVTLQVTRPQAPAVMPLKAPRAQAAHRVQESRGRAGREAAPESAGREGTVAPQHANPVHERVDDLWRAAGLGGYRWTRREEEAWRDVLAAAGGDAEEAYRRLANAVRYEYPLCTGLRSLAWNWNGYGGPPAPANTRKGAQPEAAPPPGADVGRAAQLPETEAGRIWARVLEALRAEGATYAASTLAEACNVTLEGGGLVTYWGDAFKRDWARDHYASLLQAHVGEGAPPVRFEVAGRDAP